MKPAGERLVLIAVLGFFCLPLFFGLRGFDLEMLAQLGAFASSYEIRIVDDGSRDATAAVVRQIAQKDSRVVLQREPHGGKGAAVRAGSASPNIDMCWAEGSIRW